MNRSLLLKKLIGERILVLDGAMGTAIQARNLGPEDFGGADLEGCNENLVLTRPEIIEEIHLEYLKNGADIVETNTFGATPLVLDEYQIGSKALEINRIAAQLARRAADKMTTPERPRFVAGSIGPTTKAITVTGGVTFEELVENFAVQTEGLIEGGADYFLIETCQDTRNIKAALFGIDQAQAKMKTSLPIAVSGTIEASGTMLAGQNVEALYASLAHRDLLYLGLNCATGPEFMTDHIRSLARICKFPIACIPNAGLPDEMGRYLETPEMVAGVLSRFIEKGWINVIGGCCGTHNGHIHALHDLAKDKKPRVPNVEKRSFLSGVEYLELSDDQRPIQVGERTNVIGSRKFKRLISDGKVDEASEIARAQIRNGAQILDVCLANPDRDEMADMKAFLEITIKKVKTPLMIDSTDAKVIEMSLSYSQGKAIINSINLEDGEERFEDVVPLAKKFGAALIVGTIDDDPQTGMGITRERKLEIARRSFDLLTKKYGIDAEDIYWDPLVFPCGTGDVNYVGSAVETIEGIRLLKQAFPGTKTVLGISNVSFGLPEHGREVLNSVFLQHCVQSGLDLAIVNSEKLVRYPQIPEEEIKLCDDLLWNRGADPIAAFAAHFRNRVATPKDNITKLPLMERIPQYVLEGSKDGLIADLNEALQTLKPMEVINGPLMTGMDKVGKLFNENKLIVAEVLQSAEVMKAAVAHLEGFMEKSSIVSRGKVLLATVKGDVHDIGKNLVEIILSNNGFEVINLGIKIPPEQLIKAIREHKPNIVGLSGLLVKSALQMVVTAEDLLRAGIETPIMVGGAALTSNFVDRQIAPAYGKATVAYAKDAMSGLDLAKTLTDQGKHDEFKKELETRRASLKLVVPSVQAQVEISTKRSSALKILGTFPQPPDFDRHSMSNTRAEVLFRFINPLMLYGRHLGIKGGTVRKLEAALADSKKLRELETTEPKAVSIFRAVEEVKAEYKDTEFLKASAVYQFFGARSKGNKVELFSEALTSQYQNPAATFEFPRQKKPDGLCLSDYVSDQLGDNVAMFVVSVGRGVREIAEQFKTRGDYLKSHIIQALAIETAEAYAEYLHSFLRKSWGFPDETEMTMMERFQAKYHGKRYSFGYPACPRLNDQTTLFELLKPNSIGVQLTDGFMMEPEASVSAIVFHHPEANYFSVGNADDENRS